MSLIPFIGRPDVVAVVKPLRPKLLRKIDAPLRVEPPRNHYVKVGTASDYLPRIELQRLTPHAMVGRFTSPWWVTTKGPR
jgi:hypothetical protein